MVKIRSNDHVIIGLTGKFGSGCTELAKFLAFGFKEYIFRVIKEDYDSKIRNLYERLNQIPDKDSQEAAEIKISLKFAFENRDIVDVINRNKLDIEKASTFYYISFSDVLIYFVLKYLEKSASFGYKGLYEVVSNKLARDGYSFLAVKELIDEYDNPAIRGSGAHGIHKKVHDLFGYFNEIKSEIVGRYSRNILQNFGDNLRNSGNPFDPNRKPDLKKTRLISMLIDRYIRTLRRLGFKYFVVECFRSPQEVYYFREKYPYFYLISIEAGGEIRKKRTAKDLGPNFSDMDKRENGDNVGIITKSFFDGIAIDLEVVWSKLIERKYVEITPRGCVVTDKIKRESFFLDSVENEIIQQINNILSGVSEKNEIYKLDVSRCIDLADISLSNEGRLSELYDKIPRYFAMIIEPGSVKPLRDESLMNIAHNLSVNSRCISRQVGAVIANEEGYIIGAGWNDVGENRISCGFKKASDYNNIPSLVCNGLDLSDVDKEYYVCYKDHLSDVNDRNLVYCQALHAEENAILQLARSSSSLSRNATIYTTSYPCNLCLKKITHSGIKRIVFSESYPNSKSDNILRELAILPERFQGVKAFSYFKLFKPYYDRKEQQKILSK